MKRILTLVAAFVALTACEIEQAEYFDPTAEGFRMFSCANYHLWGQATIATHVLFFDRYYSAPEEERETIHDRYFYSSRIVGSDNEWRIIDNRCELTIYTDGRSLSTDGATWRYACSCRNYAGDDLPTITCRTNDAHTSYNLRLPNGGGELSFTATYYSQPHNDGTTRYGCELQIEGHGECAPCQDYYYDYGFEKIAYEIVEPLKYTSNSSERFDAGQLRLTTETAEGPLETHAEYLDDSIRIRFGIHEGLYCYY